MLGLSTGFHLQRKLNSWESRRFTARIPCGTYDEELCSKHEFTPFMFCNSVCVCVCVPGDEGFFFHQDSEACDPEGVHGQRYSGWEKPEAELWKPYLQQLHAGCKSFCVPLWRSHQFVTWAVLMVQPHWVSVSTSFIYPSVNLGQHPSNTQM